MIRKAAPLALVFALVPLPRAAFASDAAPAPSALSFVDGRAGQSLDGPWHVIIDPYDNGGVDYRNKPRAHG